MNLQEWREKRQRGEDATLPSGLVVRLRKVSLLDLAEQGRIPTTLAPKISEIASGKTPSLRLDQIGEMAEAINIVAAACLVEPDDLDVAELPYDDRLAIFQWAGEVSTKLQFFRGESPQPVAA